MKKNLLWLGLIVVISGFVLWPLTRPGFFISDDGEWMVIRLTAFFQSLREGQFPVRFLGRLNNGYGYPVANFLYPGFLYIGSLIHAFGVPFVESVKIILAGSIIGSAFFLFLWLRMYFGQTASFFGSISFLASPYVLYDLYKRGSVGEILAFLPATAGLYSIASRRRWLFALAVALLIVSHNSLALLFIPVFVLAIAREKAWEFILPFLLGVGMAGFFWLPAFFERTLVLFDTVKISDPAQYFAQGNMWWLIGPGSIAAFIFALFLKTKRKKTFYLVIFLASVSLALPISERLWQWHTFAKLFQFPYRLLSVSVVFGAWLTALAGEATKGTKRMAIFALFILVWLRFAIPILDDVEYVFRPESYYTTNEGTTTVADEYLPQWVKQNRTGRAASRIEFVQAGGTMVPKTAAFENIDHDITSSDDTFMQINTIYYPGWGVLVDGKRVEIDYDNPWGLMRVSMPSGTHRLQAQFRETPARFAADLVSLGSFILLVVCMKKRR